MDGPTRLSVVDLNKNLTCILCKGYLVDATSIIECLHSFCRTCIVTYLKTSKSCPTCDTVVHKTRPHQNIRSDKLLQDLVYKLVPGLYKDEMRRRREFYSAHYEDAPKRPGEERGDEMCDRFIFASDELISLALHFCPNGGEESSWKSQVFKTREQYWSRMEKKAKESIDVRYLQCQAAVTVSLLKKFIRIKYDLPPDYQIEMFTNDDLLVDSSTLADVAYTCCWRRKGPLRISFSVYEITTKNIKLGESVPQLTHSSCLKWKPIKVSSPPASSTSTPIVVPKAVQPHDVPKPLAPITTPASKSEKTGATVNSVETVSSSQIKMEVKSPPNGLVPTATSSSSSSSPLKPKPNSVVKCQAGDKGVKGVEKKSSKSSSKSSNNRKSILGKRPAKSPIRIAPAPARDGPILKMPKMIKLETPQNSPNSGSVPPTVQRVPCTLGPFPSASTPSATVPLFPLVSSSLIPSHNIRTGQPSFVKAFPAGLLAISPAMSPAPSSVNLCSFPSNPGGLSPASVSVARTLTTSTTNQGPPGSISRALSSLSLSSPPLPGGAITTASTPQRIISLQHFPNSSPLTTTIMTTSTTASLLPANSSSSTTPATVAFSITNPPPPSTSIASPTPAASASPTPAAIPSQQSQTFGSDGPHPISNNSNSHPSFSQTQSAHSSNGNGQATPSGLVVQTPTSVNGHVSTSARSNGHASTMMTNANNFLPQNGTSTMTGKASSSRKNNTSTPVNNNKTCSLMNGNKFSSLSSNVSISSNGSTFSPLNVNISSSVNCNNTPSSVNGIAQATVSSSTNQPASFTNIADMHHHPNLNGYARNVTKPPTQAVLANTKNSLLGTKTTTTPSPAPQSQSNVASAKLSTTTPTSKIKQEHNPSPPSSAESVCSGGGAAGSSPGHKKQTKPKKIADVANKLHKRVTQTTETQNTPKRSQSPSTRRQQQQQQQQLQQQMGFTALKPHQHHHQDSKLFNMNGQHPPLIPLGVAAAAAMKRTQPYAVAIKRGQPLGVAIKQGQPLGVANIKQGQGQPLTSSLFDPKSMHSGLLNGRLEEQPLNLVKRDKDFRISSGLSRSEIPPAVK